MRSSSADGSSPRAKGSAPSRLVSAAGTARDARLAHLAGCRSCRRPRSACGSAGSGCGGGSGSSGSSAHAGACAVVALVVARRLVVVVDRPRRSSSSSPASSSLVVRFAAPARAARLAARAAAEAAASACRAADRRAPSTSSLRLEAAQPEEQVRIAVDLLAEQVVDRRDVLARVRGVGARAGGLEVAVRAREEREAEALEHLLDALGHLARRQRRGRARGSAGELLRHLLPVGAREHREAHAHEIRCVARALHLRGDEALADLELEHLTLTCVDAAAPEPAPDLEALEHVDPAPRPPVLGAAAAALPRAPAAVRASVPALRARVPWPLRPPRALPIGAPLSSGRALAVRCGRGPPLGVLRVAARPRAVLGARAGVAAARRARRRGEVARPPARAGAASARRRDACGPDVRARSPRGAAARRSSPPGRRRRRQPRRSLDGLRSAAPSLRRFALAHSRTASLRSANMSCSSSFESSVIQVSPPPTMSSATLALALDHLVDALLERAGTHVLVDLHVARLADAERAVGGLVLDGRVPPAVEVEDVVRRGEVQAEAAGLEREHEDRPDAQRAGPQVRVCRHARGAHRRDDRAQAHGRRGHRRRRARTWITELSNEELHDMFALRKDAVRE